MTKDEAEIRLKKHKNMSLGFCPLINDKCKTDCINYCKSNIRKVRYSGNIPKTENTIYIFHKESCSSPLITGNITNHLG